MLHKINNPADCQYPIAGNENISGIIAFHNNMTIKAEPKSMDTTTIKNDKILTKFFILFECFYKFLNIIIQFGYLVL